MSITLTRADESYHFPNSRIHEPIQLDEPDVELSRPLRLGHLDETCALSGLNEKKYVR